MKVTTIWTIGGADPTGGAGVQKDAATFRDFGLQCSSIVTCVTAQNHLGIQQLNALPLHFISSQVEALIPLGIPSYIKIGLIGSVVQLKYYISLIAAMRKKNPKLTVVLDPVTSAEAGGETNNISAFDMKQLVSMCDVITPNESEWFWFNERELTKESSSESIATLNQNTIKTSVIVTGIYDKVHDHLEEKLLTTDGAQSLFHRRIDQQSAHGTGCQFSSALCAVMSLGYELEDAFVVAVAYMHQCIDKPISLTEEKDISFIQAGLTGWPLESEFMPVTNLHTVIAFPKIDQNKFNLYPIVDSAEWLERLLKEGVQTIQLRIKKEIPISKLRLEIRKSVQLANQYAAQLFINDYWELAIEAGAYGVHLGQEDLDRADINAIHKAGLRLGVSTHGYWELVVAANIKPSYIALGHIFSTQTKQMPSKPQGVQRLQRYCQWANSIAPTVAIGGINRTNVADVLATDVTAIAVVSAITQAKNPTESTHYFSEVVRERITQ